MTYHPYRLDLTVLGLSRQERFTDHLSTYAYWQSLFALRCWGCGRWTWGCGAEGHRLCGVCPACAQPRVESDQELDRLLRIGETIRRQPHKEER